MHAPASPTIRAGLLAGALLYLHALLPNSHAYPLVWPLVGGALALLWAVRRSAGAVPLTRTLGIGVGVGALAALVAAAALAPTYLFMTTGAGGPLARALGGSGPLPYSPLALGALLFAMLLAVPAGLLGSAIARPFARATRT